MLFCYLCIYSYPLPITTGADKMLIDTTKVRQFGRNAKQNHCFLRPPHHRRLTIAHRKGPPFFGNSDTPVPLIVKTENMQLNLPGFDIKIGGTKARPTVFDILRRKYVALTPEEWVRQHFVHYLIETKGYPATLLANEVKLSIGTKVLRADSVLYTTALTPRMIIEYKAPHIKISQHTFDQIFAYNLLLRAQYLVISNGLHHYCCKYDESLQKYLFLEEIPGYENL